MKLVKSFFNQLNQSVEPEKIAVFRVGFGTVLFLQAIYFYAIDFIKLDILERTIHFPYYFLGFIKVLDPIVMKALLLGMLFSSMSLLLGYRARLASAVYLFSFSYLWLIDKGFYNNHYYLISLLLLLMCFIKSDNALAIKKHKKEYKNYRWEEFILIFQFSIVLIFAGFNKINEWWLVYHEPVHHILLYKSQITANRVWESKFLELMMIWGGLFFDLLIIPLLLWKKTRSSGLVLFLFFNGMNTLLFYNVGEIGIFPLLMLSSLVLFYPRADVKSLLKKLFNYKSTKSDSNTIPSELPLIKKYFISIFIIIQVLLPLRHHLFEGNVDYTGEAQRFSWRMKSVYKDFEISFKLVDEDRGIEATLDPRSVLSVKQYTNLGYYPELILPVADNLREKAKEKGVKNPKIYVDYRVGFMGLPLQYMVDPTVELAGISFSPFKHSDWIIPLKR